MCQHEHDHDHGHCHDHEHPHAHDAHSPEETLALLTYMLGHNRHHAVDGEAQQLLHDAVVDFTLGNEKLEEALRILKGE